MHSQTDINIVFHLALTEEEAAWLKARMQNELSPGEAHEDTVMREKFFVAVKECKL